MAKVCYLLHFTPASYKHAKHYLGFTSDLAGRLERHRAGSGARIVEVATAAGLSFEVARIWKRATRALERKLKARKNSCRLCPICSAEKRGADRPGVNTSTPRGKHL